MIFYVSTKLHWMMSISRGVPPIFLGVKKADLVPLRVFNLKRFTAGTFCDTFSCIEPKKTVVGDNLLF